MLISKAKGLAGVVLVSAALAAGATLATHSLVASPAALVPMEQQAAAAVDKPAARGKIIGRVLAKDNTPVAGADVRLQAYSDSPRPSSYAAQPVVKTRTNDKGEFTFDRLKPGKQYVYAFHGNQASEWRTDWGKVVTVEPNGASQPVVLTLRRSGASL